jgi:hypothetical protein
MSNDILKLIRKIPGMIEFIFGAFIFLIIWFAGNEVISGVAKETVCETPGIVNQFLCFYFTNPVISFVLTVATIIVIGVAFRKKFLKN